MVRTEIERKDMCRLHQDTDVFNRLDKDARKTARKVCISTILHTDNVAVLHEADRV